jgi:hypothetical protein
VYRYLLTRYGVHPRELLHLKEPLRIGEVLYVALHHPLRCLLSFLRRLTCRYDHHLAEYFPPGRITRTRLGNRVKRGDHMQQSGMAFGVDGGRRIRVSCKRGC